MCYISKNSEKEFVSMSSLHWRAYKTFKKQVIGVDVYFKSPDTL